MKQTNQPVCAIKKSIYSDVYDMNQMRRLDVYDNIFAQIYKIIGINVERPFYLKIKGKIYWIFMQKNKSFSNLTGWSLVSYK
jgi:hypothetical protein